MTNVGVTFVVFDVALARVLAKIGVPCVVVVPFVGVVVGIPLLVACETMYVIVVVEVFVGVVVAQVVVGTQFVSQGIIGIPTVV